MIIIPDVPKLKSMLEEAIEKNTALLEKVRPLYLEAYEQKKIEREKKKEKYLKAYGEYTEAVKKWHENKSWCKGEKPVYNGPENPDTDFLSLLDFGCDFYDLTAKLRESITTAKAMLYNLQFTSTITEMNADDMEGVRTATDWKRYEKRFEDELEYVSKYKDKLKENT